jgi:Bardet-Biedl syndrome 2 protein
MNREGMKRHYLELMNTNRDLVNGYKIRSTNHEELLKNVKNLNQIVQRAGNLRGRYYSNNLSYYKKMIAYTLNINLCYFKAGKYKTDLIANARQAIKQNNSISLVKIIKNGVS